MFVDQLDLLSLNLVSLLCHFLQLSGHFFLLFLTLSTLPINLGEILCLLLVHGFCLSLVILIGGLETLQHIDLFLEELLPGLWVLEIMGKLLLEHQGILLLKDRSHLVSYLKIELLCFLLLADQLLRLSLQLNDPLVHVLKLLLVAILVQTGNEVLVHVGELSSPV